MSSRHNKHSRNDDITHLDSATTENLKRIKLLLNRVQNVLAILDPRRNDQSWLSDLLTKARRGVYFVNIGLSGRQVNPDESTTLSFRGVDWGAVTLDIQMGYSSVSPDERTDRGEKDFEILALPEKVVDEINYEVERQMLEIPKPESLSDGKMQALQSRNGQPMFPHKWRKEPYRLREYDPIDHYVAASCVDNKDGEDLQAQLVTDLDGYLGPAYNYDDRSLTEEWMLNFRDTMAEPPSEDDIVRTQMESLMEIMLGQVQDKVCNDLGALEKEPVGLGPRLREQPVWGIDCNTNRTLELIVEDAYLLQSTDGYETWPSGMEYSTGQFKRFIERVLLPTINAVPSSVAHRMDKVLKRIIEKEGSSPLDVHYAEILLKAVLETESDEYFRIHPKGTGVVCMDPAGIPAHVVIAEYLGEMFPPYRWCEKLDVVQQAQKIYDLKPTLPDFYNILLERPRRDPAGYGLIFVDASQRANLGSSCSHSCDANCTSAVVARNGKLCIVLTTNRPVHFGEELCMDYYSITTSEVEWRAAICLCGSMACRGSFLHFATQDDLQQVLVQRCAPAYRVASLLRGCTDNRFSERDYATLTTHSIGNIALGGCNALWMKKFAVDNLRFLEYERKALPCALLRARDGSPSPYTFSSADMDARCVLEQRMQSLVCCFSLVSKFLGRQPEHLKDKKPVRMLSVSETVPKVWALMQSIPKLLQKHLAVKRSKGGHETGQGRSGSVKIATAIADIRTVLAGESPPASLSALRERLNEVASLVAGLHEFSTPTARLRLLTDVIALWRNTSNFAVVEEYEPISSSSIDVVARELGTTTIAKDKIKKILGSECRLLAHNADGKATVKSAHKKLLSAPSLDCPHSVSPSGVDVDDMEVVPDQAAHAPSDTYKTNFSTAADDDAHALNGNGHMSNGALGMDCSPALPECQREEDFAVAFDTYDPANEAPKPLPLVRKSKGFSTPKTSMTSLQPNDIIFEGSKKYPSSYPFWQVIGWFNAGTDQDSSEPDLFGTCILPTPAECFGPSETDYTFIQRDALLSHLNSDQSQAMPWPEVLRRCFSGDLQQEERNPLIGSPVLDVSLGRVDAVGTCLDEMFGVNRQRAHEDFTQFDNNLPPEMPTEWVQCELCFKWRRVPFHVILDDLPEYWTCALNFWDESEKANCDAPQDAFDPEKESTVDAVVKGFGEEPCKVNDWKDVFCLRNQIYYEAKVLKIRVGKNGKPEAKFHFKGWKTSQDEWIEIGSDRIAPYHLYTDATSSTVKDQEKWQGYKGSIQCASAKKRYPEKSDTKTVAKKSRRSK